VAVSYAAVPDWTARHSHVSSTEALERGLEPPVLAPPGLDRVLDATSSGTPTV